jgi:predicted dehydrogenase
LEALDAGLHVLGEKPMAATVVEAREMLASAKEKGLVLDIGYQYPFMVEAAVNAVRDGLIGDVRRIQANWLRQDGIPPQASFWRSAESGGVTLDLLGHVLSAALPFVDKPPIWVSAQTWRDFGAARHQDGFRAEDTVAATLRFDGGVRGLFTAAWAACIPDLEQFHLWVHGSRGTLEIPLMTVQDEEEAEQFRPILHARVFGKTADQVISEPLPGPTPPTVPAALRAQARNWLRACQGHEPLRFTAEQALHIQRILRGVYASAHHDRPGEEVTLDRGRS